MSRHGTILDTSAPAVKADIDARIRAWHEGAYAPNAHPRAAWLTFVETALAHYFPKSSAADRNVTARSLAPFPLKERP